MSDVTAHTDVKMGSERSFGLVFSAVFAIIAFWPLIHGGGPRWWSLAVAAVFLILAWLKPEVLGPLNRLWFKFGLLLNRIISPLVMGIIFFLTVTPIGLIRRLRNPDPLQQNFDRDAPSYWIDRTTAEVQPTSMRKQF